jgi:hypothetical protein
MVTRAMCLSVSKKNKRVMDMVEDYSLQFNLNTSQTIFRIVREYDQMKRWSYCNRELNA